MELPLQTLSGVWGLPWVAFSFLPAQERRLWSLRPEDARSTEGQTRRKAQLPPRRGEGARPDPPPEEPRAAPWAGIPTIPSRPPSLEGGKRPRRRPIRGARGGSQARRRERAGRCHSARMARAAPGGSGLRGAEASRTWRPGLLRPLGSSSPRGGLPPAGSPAAERRAASVPRRRYRRRRRHVPKRREVGKGRDGEGSRLPGPTPPPAA